MRESWEPAHMEIKPTKATLSNGDPIVTDRLSVRTPAFWYPSVMDREKAEELYAHPTERKYISLFIVSKSWENALVVKRSNRYIPKYFADVWNFIDLLIIFFYSISMVPVYTFPPSKYYSIYVDFQSLFSNVSEIVKRKYRYSLHRNIAWARYIDGARLAEGRYSAFARKLCGAMCGGMLGVVCSVSRSFQIP